MIENNIWEKKKDLENIKKAKAKFEKLINAEVKQQEDMGRKNLDKVCKVKLNPNVKEFRRSKLLKKYIVKFCLDGIIENLRMNI